MSIHTWEISPISGQAVRMILYFMVACVAWNHPASLHGQTITGRSPAYRSVDTSYTSSPGYAGFLFADSTGQSFGHFCDVGQFHERTAIIYSVGEFTVTGLNKTVRIVFDHPLFTHLFTPLLNVYHYNSLEYENELVTKPFTLFPGDTLTFYRLMKIEFPVKNTSGQHFQGHDTALFMNPDSLVFRTLLVEDGSRRVLDTLDAMTVLPGYSFSSALRTISGQIHMVGTTQGFDCRRGVDENWTGRTLRIKLEPVYQSQLRGQFDARAMYARYYWEPDARKDFERIIFLYRRILDTMAMTKPKSVPERMAQMQVYPTVVSKNNPVVSVHLPDAPEVGINTRDLHVDLYDILGNHVYSTSFHKIQNNAVTMHLRIADVVPGVYLLRAKSNIHVTQVYLKVVR